MTVGARGVRRARENAEGEGRMFSHLRLLSLGSRAFFLPIAIAIAATCTCWVRWATRICDRSGTRDPHTSRRTPHISQDHSHPHTPELSHTTHGPTPPTATYLSRFPSENTNTHVSRQLVEDRHRALRTPVGDGRAELSEAGGVANLGDISVEVSREELCYDLRWGRVIPSG